MARHAAETASASAAAEKKTATEKQEQAPKKEKLKFSYKEQREYEQIDELVAQAEEHLVQIAAEMEKAFSDSLRLQELMQQQAQGEAELERLMERWTYLNELAERIEENK
ncbi:ABC transporter ATPase component [compost metagenome]